MNFSRGVLLAALLSGCSAPTDALVVKQFQLRNQVTDDDEDPMVRAEKMRRLHGAVSMKERGERLGQYYTLLWNHPEGEGQGEIEVRFDYQQGATGSRVKTMSAKFPASETTGKAGFSVTGDDYFTNGRVLAWKASLLRGGRVLDTKQSYLWQ